MLKLENKSKNNETCQTYTTKQIPNTNSYELWNMDFTKYCSCTLEKDKNGELK